MRLNELEEQYKKGTDTLKKLQTEKTKIEERLSIKKTELASLQKTLEASGVDTANIEEEYKKRKKALQEDVQKFSDGLIEFEKNLKDIKEKL